MRSIFTAAFVLLLTFSIFAQTSPPVSWSPEMQVKTRVLGNPRISPDGTRVVYTVNEAVMTADKSEFVTQVWLASADGKENFQVTYGEKSSTNPKWSPDGNWIAFTSNRKDNKNNLYVLRVNGGEAEQVTEVKSAVSDSNGRRTANGSPSHRPMPRPTTRKKTIRAKTISAGWMKT